MPEFVVSYERNLSTVNQEIKTTGEVAVKLDRRPRRKDFPAIEEMLEEKFLNDHKKELRNLLCVSYKIKRVLR